MCVKITVNINDEIWGKFTQMVEEEELSRTYTVNEALSDWVLIKRTLKDKHKILLDNGSGIIKELERRPNGRGKSNENLDYFGLIWLSGKILQLFFC